MATPGKVSLVQQLPVVQLAPAPAADKPDNHVDLYLKVNDNQVWPAVRDQFASVVWPTPDPRIAWDDQRRFAQKLAESLSSTVHFDEPSQLREVVFPANPVFVLEPLYPGTNMLWVPTMGTALGQMLQDAIIPSLARIGPRWVAAAQHHPNPEAATDPTAPLVHYHQIITSAPIDRAVAFALCAAGSISLAGGTDGKAVATSKPQPLRVVKTLEWQGGRDRSLWNWVKALDPPDATAEDVAATLFKRHDGKYGEATSFDAYALTVAPPMFGVPPSWARGMRGAKDYAPAPGTTDESQPGRWAALGRDKASDAIALAEQGRPGAKAEAPQAAALLKTLGDSVLVVQTMLGHLVSWRLSAPVGVAYSWLLGKEAQIATMSPAELAQWAPIITAQQDRLGRISTGVHDTLRAAPRMGIANPDAPGAVQVTDLLKLYASATAVSHLHNECEALIGQAAAQQALVGAKALRATVNDMNMVAGHTSGVLSRDEQQEAADLTVKGNELQAKLARGEAVDAAALDETSLASEELAFKGRIFGLIDQTARLEGAAQAAGEGLASHIAKYFHGSFKKLEQAITPIRRTLQTIEAFRQDASSDESMRIDSHPGVDDATERRIVRRMALNKAKDELAELRKNSNLTDFLQEGASIVKWQNFATACVKTLALIGVSFLSAGVGSAIGEAAEGVFAAGMGADSVADLSAGARIVAGGIRYTAGAAAESAGNAAGQIAIQGDDASFGGAFFENMIQKVGSDVVLGQLAKDLGAAKDLEKRAGGMWVKRAGKFVLKETVVITAHTLWGAAIGNVAHMIVERKVQAASPTELRDWFLQGAATALGRYAHKLGQEKQPLATKLGTLGLPSGNRPALTNKQLLLLADRAQSHPTGDDAIAIVRTRNELLNQLDHALGELESRPDISRHADVGDAVALRTQIADQRAELASGPTEDLAIQDAGLRNVANSGVYEGSSEQIDRAIASAKRMGLEGKRSGKNLATGNEILTLGDRTFEVHQTGPGGERKVTATEDAIRWDNEVREKLTPEEREKLDKIREEATQATREDLKRERPELFANGAPATRFIDTARGRKLYFEITDMDLVVTQDNASGKRKVVHREELKTGAGDRPSKARAQLDKGAASMTAAANGRAPVVLFEGNKDITSTI
ncbi:MAG TPA: hypothetical protein VHT91_00920, partial [Kofleriaceae bacterium]|nr:hypothetical protein [Kofleriaceae bacterium]